MLPDSEIFKRLEFHEGFRAKKYHCSAGKLTQGIGHNLTDNPLTKEELLYIKDLDNWTHDDAVFILAIDVRECKRLLANLVKGYSFLDDERQYALLDMCFQLGPLKLLKFRKMLNAIQVHDWSEASKQCLDSKYAREDTPIRAERIANLLKTGVWRI